MAAFRATLEELEDADLLLHVADISSEYLEHHIQVVDKTLSDLDLNGKSRLLVLNKVDRIPPETAANLARRFEGVLTCALDKNSLLPLTEKMGAILWP